MCSVFMLQTSHKTIFSRDVQVCDSDHLNQVLIPSELLFVLIKHQKLTAYKAISTFKNIKERQGE